MAANKKNKKKAYNPAAAKKKKNDMLYFWIGVGIIVVLAAVVLVLRQSAKKAEYEATHGRTTDVAILEAYFAAIQNGKDKDVEILYRAETAGWFDLAKQNDENERFTEFDTFLAYYDRLYEYYGMPVVSWEIVSSTDESPEDFSTYSSVMGITIEAVRDFIINATFDTGSGEVSVPVKISVLRTDGRWYIKNVLSPDE